MSEPKRQFDFLSDRLVPPSNEERVANALEFIAHYLERIDDHLESISKMAVGETIRSADVVRHLETIARESRKKA